MFLKEYEGRSLLVKYGVRVPAGFVVKRGSDFADELAEFKKQTGKTGLDDLVLKVQVQRGKRGKNGGVIFSGGEKINTNIENLFKMEFVGNLVDEIMIQERVEVKKELYLSITIDRASRKPLLVFSVAGGIDIEETAKNNPGEIFKCVIGPDGFDKDALMDYLLREKIDVPAMELFDGLIKNLFELFEKEDALLAEINPLVITRSGNLEAVDIKITIDDNALFRHPSLNTISEREYSKLENSARSFGLSYVELDGDIAVIGNGAGLVMATLDSISIFGGRPANFCDIGGGASMEMMYKAMETVLEKKSVKVLLINIFGGITHCDVVAEAIAQYKRKNPDSPTIVVRIIGTNEKEAVDILADVNINAFTSFEEAIKEAIKYANTD